MSNIKIINKSVFKEYKKLSPFELKNRLIKLAEGSNPSKLLNAGRGNPNFFNKYIRDIFAKLQSCVLNTTDNLENPYHIDREINSYFTGGNKEIINTFPSLSKHNYKKLLLSAISKWSNRDKIFMKHYFKYLEDNCSLKDKNKIFYDIYLSTLGCFYPSPPQIQLHLEIITRQFMHKLIFDNEKTSLKPDDFDVFATEGAANGILYVFNTLEVFITSREYNCNNCANI